MKLITTGLSVRPSRSAVRDRARAGPTQITGAGSTFARRSTRSGVEAAKAAIGVQLNYQAIGSGAGQNQIINRTVDFGASDAPVGRRSWPAASCCSSRP